ncbi:chromosome segregation protein SMC [Mycoplasmopsis citelli]|uniref:Chromosome segregation protein SMC n=1 Tax=Mycoplasmopsis citelli TaxID=171281 RepID=A0A449B149_9BACT|nr:hypothetical protein [Mycoplasmopsis citelli]VEU74306.1 chromosome segregation protein SMC [Mycoplasmopsis citelli]
MKANTKKFLLIGTPTVTALGIGFVGGFLSGAIPYKSQVSLLQKQLNQVNLELQKYKDQNKDDKLKLQLLQSEKTRLELLVSDLQGSSVNKDDFSEVLKAFKNELKDGKRTQDIIANVGYKEFKASILDFEKSLASRILKLSSMLNQALKDNSNLTPGTKEELKKSIAKAQELLELVNKSGFKNLKDAVNAFDNLSKAQKIYFAQLNNSIDLMNNQISQHEQQTNALQTQITNRDGKIKELAQKLIQTLSFYLKLISQFKETLNDFNKLNLEQINPTKAQEIKAKVLQTLERLTIKENVFNELFNKMNSSLEQAQAKNDYSDIFSYDAVNVSNSFEEIVRDYEFIRSAVIPLYASENQDKTLQIMTQQKQIQALKNQSESLQTQVDNLAKTKTTLEANIVAIKNDLKNNLGSMLNNQITSLNGIESSIRSSNTNDATNLADRLKIQITALENLKNQYTADNYTETFAPTINQALTSAQEVIEEYKRSVLDKLKSEYQSTLENLTNTKKELTTTKSDLGLKNQELQNIQSSLTAVQAELAKNKENLQKTQDDLASAQNSLNSLNNQIATNKTTARTTYNAFKDVYDNLKAKATTLLGVVQSDVDLTTLQNQLAQSIPNFDEDATLDQMQASIKELIDFSTSLNNAYGDVLQKDYDSQAQKQTQTIASLQTSKEQIQRELNSLNSELANNKTKAKSSYEAVKTVYDTLKSKAQNFLSQLDNSVNSDKLNQELAKPIVTFDENANLEEQQASIKELIESSTTLNDAYRNTLQQDYDAKAQKQSQTITTLQSSKQQFERELNSLNEKQAQFKNALTTNLTQAQQEYNQRKTSAQSVINQAKALSLNTSTLKSLIDKARLSTSSDNVDEQINLLNEYSQRIDQLTQEIFKLQEQIIAKNQQKYQNTQNQLTTTNNNLKTITSNFNALNVQKSSLEQQLSSKQNQYQNSLSRINNLNSEILSLNNRINSLNTENKNLQNAQNSLISTQADLIRTKNQLDAAKLEISKLIQQIAENAGDFVKYKDLILNSDVIKKATKLVSNANIYVGSRFPIHSGVENHIKTAYSSNEDQKEYDTTFYKFNPNNSYQKTISVINKIVIKPEFPHSWDPEYAPNKKYKFKVSYIDISETDDAKKLKDKEIELSTLDIDDITISPKLFLLSSTTKYASNGSATIQEFIFPSKYSYDGNLEFSNVVVVWYKESTSTSIGGVDYRNIKVSAITPVVGVEKIN